MGSTPRNTRTSSSPQLWPHKTLTLCTAVLRAQRHMSVARCWTTGMDTHVHVCMPVPLRVLTSGAHIWPTLHITYTPPMNTHTHIHTAGSFHTTSFWPQST